MANILDYLNWRGDLTLAQSPFNEVDNLILAELSFVNFTGIVPGPERGRACRSTRRRRPSSGAMRAGTWAWACWCRTRSRRC